MSDVRWDSPFPYTMAFNLFKQHFEEINRTYWAFVAASNTIKKYAKTNLKNDEADPKSFFLIPDEEDKHLAPSYGDWKKDFSEFGNYSRLNVIMLLSSCFETYFRTVVSLAFESKPGVIIKSKDAVDGAETLKKDSSYGDVSSKSYQFTDQIDEICKGEWVSKRFVSFQNYFGILPEQLLSSAVDLDELRVKRNNLAHYFGRNPSHYVAPLDFEPQSVILVSHEKILKYFALVFSVAQQIDKYLKKEYIGTYDIIKCYFNALSKGNIHRDDHHPISQQLATLMGKNYINNVKKSFYTELVDYCDLHYCVSKNDCLFCRKQCLFEINRRLAEDNVQLISGGRVVQLNSHLFALLVEKDNLWNDERYSKKNSANKAQTQYFHSTALIEYIINKLEAQPRSIIDELKSTES